MECKDTVYPFIALESYIYTPNLGFWVIISVREREQGRFRGSREGAERSKGEYRGSIIE